MAKTLYQKLVDKHTVKQLSDDEVLLYVNFHIMNEYTSPQAFSGLDLAGRNVWNPSTHLGVVDHVNSTRRAGAGDGDEQAALLIENFKNNCQKHNILLFDEHDERQGIEHVVVPEQGFAKPGIVIACGDSHTTTYGAFGALGFGIGTSEVEHVLATQCLVYRILKNMRININGQLAPGVTAKDIIIEVINHVGAGAANGYAVEFSGNTIETLDMSERMTICNMAVELGARAALMAPNAVVLQSIADKAHGPNHEQLQSMAENLDHWQSDSNATFDQHFEIDAATIAPRVSWGTSPDQSIAINETIPLINSYPSAQQETIRRALQYMGLEEGAQINRLPIDATFIGSCTNSRIEDLRAAAKIVSGHQVAKNVHAIVVPGSKQVLRQATEEGLRDIFITAGFDWRDETGCSMCLAMNDDVAETGTRLASSTNRNFEGRQGQGARTHLMSPAMVAAAAINGYICDVRELEPAHA